MKSKKLSRYERQKLIESDAQYRREIFERLLKHTREGFSLGSFDEVSEATVKRYFEKYPEEFVLEEYEEALRSGMHFWEGIGKKQATGDCLGNSRTWYYIMANRYGWREKVDVKADHSGEVKVQVVSYASQKPSQDI